MSYFLLKSHNHNFDLKVTKSKTVCTYVKEVGKLKVTKAQ